MRDRWSDRCSAIDFGTSSPATMASVVRTSRTMTADVERAASGSRPPTRSRSGATRGAIAACAYSAEDQAGERNADLRGGDVPVERVRIFDDRQHASGQSASVFSEPSQPASAGADRGELRGHEERRQQDQQGDDP